MLEMIVEESADSPQKRRKVDSETSGGNVANKGNGADISDEWRIEVNCGTDETLQIKRIETAHGSTLEPNGNLLDSYTLETLITGTRISSRPFEDINSDIDKSDYNSPGWCVASVAGQFIAVTKDKAIHILSADSACIEAVIRHDYLVTSTALSEDALFVAFGDSEGTLFIVHVGSRRVVFSRPMGTELGALRFSEIDSRSDECREELVLVAGSQLVRFAGIRLRALGRAIGSNDMTIAGQIRSEIAVESVALADKRGNALHSDGVSSVAVVPARELTQAIVAGSGAASLSSWLCTADGDSDDYVSKMGLSDAVSAECAGSEYTHVQVSASGRYVLALSRSGMLDVYERLTLTRVFRYSEAPVADFGIVTSRAAHLRIAAVVSEADDEDSAQLLIVDLPSGNVIYSMDVAKGTWLARGFNESVVFVETQPNTFFVRKLSEALPLDRLAHFLRGRRYAEAESFARAHGIPETEVCRQRVISLVDSRCEVDPVEAIDLLAGLDDEGFVTESCLRLHTKTLPETQQLLRYARSVANAKSNIASVDESLLRLGTWQAVGSHPFNAGEWHSFRSADLASCARAFLSCGDVLRASLLWRRHAHDAKLRGDLAGALQAFPSRGDVVSLAQWLKSEALPNLKTAQQRSDVDSWLEQRARALEAIPGRLTDALLLAGLAAEKLVKHEADQAGNVLLLSTPQQFIAAREKNRDMRMGPTSGAAFLHTQLLDLVLLQQKHALSLTLDSYAQLSFSDISRVFLDRVAAPELLSDAFRTHFLPYSQSHRLDHAQIAQQYCIDCMNTRKHWEPRVLQLMRCLSSECAGPDTTVPMPLTTARMSALRAYADVALEAMRRSVVPWSAPMDSAMTSAQKLLKLYADSDPDIARLSRDAAEHIRLMQLRRMLMSYGLGDFHISNTRMALPLLQCLVRRADEDVMSDMLQLVDAYHHLSRPAAYVLRIQALCEMGRPEATADLVRFVDSAEHSAPDASAADAQQIDRYVPMEVVRRALCWIREVLDSMSFSTDASREQFRLHVSAAMSMTGALESLARRYSGSSASTGSFGSDPVDKHSGRMSLIELERLQSFVSSESSVMTVVWQLLIDGGVMVSPGELEQASTRAQILSDFIDQQWLCTLVGPSAIGSKGGARSRCGHNAKGNGKDKGKGNSNAEDLMSTSTCAVEAIPLPPIPARIRTLATMLRFTSAELGQRIVLRCLELRLYTMALDMCHQLVEALNPLTASSLVQDARLQGEWPAALRALAACERSIGSLLISLNAGGLRGEAQGALVRRLSVLCQAAARKCASHTYLTHIIDAYACWDFAQCVFDQTTDGDFALLTKRPSARQTGAQTHSGAAASKRGFADSGAGSSSARNAAGSSTAASINDMLDTGKEYFDESPTDSHEGALSSWLNPLFANIYVERGLVLDTKQTMYMVYRLTMALRRLSSARSLEFADDGQRNKQRSSGKAAEPMSVGDSLDGHDDDDDHGQSDLSHEALRSSAVYRCGELVAHLVQNRHWVLAVQALELAASQLSTSAFATEHSQQCEDESSMTQIRQRLSSGGIGQDEVALLLGNSSDSSAATDIQALISKSLVRSLQQQRGLDTVFIFSAMLMSPPMRAYQYLSTAMSHAGLLPARVIDLANIGAACSLFWQQQALLDRCRSVAAAARWGEQLQLLELKFDIAQLNDPKSELLFPLVRPMLVKTGMDISTILEFAEAFKLDETSVILEYISLCCSAPHVEGYQARVLGVADEIANTKLLERTFVDCLENAISSYDYERLHFVVQRLQDLRPQDAEISKYSAVLDVLSSYDRQSSPTFDELVFEWSRTRAACSRVASDSDKKDSRESNGRAMDTDPTLSELLAEHPMALKRLPFHLLVNSAPWSTLLPELSSDTIDSLLPLAPALDLNEDDFYMNLIDSMLKKWKANDVTVAQPAGGGNSNSSGSSGMDAKAAFELAMSKTPTHFNSVQQLIRCFKDPEAAISTIKHVADEFPCGPDRIAALKMGIKLLYKWGQFIKRMAEPERSQMMTKAEAIYAHFEKSHTDATAEIELRCNGLEKHLPLFIEARSTESTIRALAAVFEDECDKYDTAGLLKAEDTEQAEEGTSNAPRESKLHETMRNLAKIYDISLESLMQKLLEGYLETSVHLARTASDLQLPSAGYQISLRLADSQEATLRRRIICILRAYPASDSVRSLLGFAYAPKGGISCLCRARALEILFSLASDEDIAQLQQPEDVHKYFQALLYMADFEYVGIPQSTADFLDCQKAALARSIWVDYHQDPRAVQLICNMCLDFGVDDCDLILQILPRLLVAGLHQYTVGVLDAISSMPCYSANIKELPELWSRTISGLFVQMASTHRHADGSGGERQDWVETVLAALGSCLRSAFLPDIDTTRIVQALFNEYPVACTDFCSAKAAAAAQQLACVAFDVLPYSQTAEGVLLGHLDALPASDIHCLIMRLLDFAECALNLSSPSIFVDWTASRSLSLIFDIVDSMGTHEQVLLNPPLGRAVHAFVHNRIRHDKLQMAVQACLNKGKQQLAMQLVSRYYQTRPTDMLVEDAKSAGIKTDAMDMTLDATSDYTSSAFSADTPTGTQEASRAARRFVKGLSEQNLLDIYLKSRTTAT